MGNVRQKGTLPELAVGEMLKILRIRYRNNAEDLPGRPDFVLLEAQVAIFVHGCFWHRHAGCRACTTPKNNRQFWLTKFAANVRRDRAAARRLRRIGYAVLTVWECRLKTPEARSQVAARFKRVLGYSVAGR